MRIYVGPESSQSKLPEIERYSANMWLFWVSLASSVGFMYWVGTL